MMIGELALTVALTASPVTSGTGWTLGGDIDHLDTKGWSVQFYDTTSRDRLSYYMKLSAAELEKQTGVDFYVGTTVHAWSDPCPGYTETGRHRIIVRLTSTVDRSSSYMCQDGYGAAYGSYVRFSLTRWNDQLRAGTHKAYRENVSSHELGHSVGLGHPDDCSQTGTDPLMCGTYWGGYSSTSSAQKYTPYDIAGLKRLVMNR